VVAGIRAALRVLASETGRVDRLRTNMARLHRRLPGHDAVANSPDTPVTRVLVPSAAAARALRKALIDAGIYPSIIRYPGGAESGFLRLALSSEHSRADVDLLAGALGIALESRAFRP
jgi:7-keto-8-aminopelargonate synthetase-like enzyme